MGQFDKDSTAKWLLGHYGDQILRFFADVGRIDRWIAAANEITVPKQVPDGLIKVWSEPQQKDADPYLIEVATYPDSAVAMQILCDIAASFAFNEKVPETTVLVLHPKGRVQVAQECRVASTLGGSELWGRWRVRPLWEESAEAALESENPGLAALAPIMRSGDRPEVLFQKCRNLIDAKASDARRLNLLASAQVLARPRYNDPRLFEILGGQTIMIESPLLDEVRAQGAVRAAQNNILHFLVKRFGAVSSTHDQTIRAIVNLDVLSDLIYAACVCKSLDEFSLELSKFASRN